MDHDGSAPLGVWGPGFGDLVRTFDEAKLELPPIPEQLRPRLRRLGPWVWATRSIEPDGMYMFREYVAELFREPVDDYVAVSHAGHGTNSYGLSYHAHPLVAPRQSGGAVSDRHHRAA